MLAPWKKNYDKHGTLIKNQRHYFADKCLYSQSYVFSSNHGWLWDSDHKEAWALKSWCFWTVVLEKTLKNPLDCKEIKPVNPKGNQPWIFIGRTDAESETPILWPPDAGKDWGKEEKGQQKMGCLEGIVDSVDMSLSKFQEILKEKIIWHAAVHEITKSWTWLSDWQQQESLAPMATMNF